MQGRENIVLGTGEQRQYLVNRRGDCTREREYCPRFRGKEAVPGKKESGLCEGEREYCPRYRGAEAVPGK